MLIYCTAPSEEKVDIEALGEAQDHISAQETPWVAQLPRSTVRIDGEDYPCFLGMYAPVILAFEHDGELDICRHLPPPPKISADSDKMAVNSTGQTLVSIEEHDAWIVSYEMLMAHTVVENGS